VRRSIEERKRKDRRLRSQLPQTTTSKQYESALKALRTQLLEWEGKRATYLRELRTLLTSKENLITAQSTELMETFGRLTHELLAEEARLAQVRAADHG
jgi:hypothetical protein